MNRRRFLFGVLAAAAAGKRVAVATPNAAAAERLRRDLAELARWMDEPIAATDIAPGREYGRSSCGDYIGALQRGTEFHRLYGERLGAHTATVRAARP